MTFLGGRIVLALGGLVFAAFGILYLVTPHAMAASVGVSMLSTGAVVDVQGIYGGLELGIGIFLGICAVDPAFTRVGLLAGMLVLGCVAVTRLVALARFGVPDATVASLIGLDLLGAGLHAWFARRYRAA